MVVTERQFRPWLPEWWHFDATVSQQEGKQYQLHYNTAASCSWNEQLTWSTLDSADQLDFSLEKKCHNMWSTYMHYSGFSWYFYWEKLLNSVAHLNPEHGIAQFWQISSIYTEAHRAIWAICVPTGPDHSGLVILPTVQPSHALLVPEGL